MAGSVVEVEATEEDAGVVDVVRGGVSSSRVAGDILVYIAFVGL